MIVLTETEVVDMKLAEALSRRADIQSRIAHLTERARTAVRVQEGDTPDEDPSALFAEFDTLLAQLAVLVAAINRVNSTTDFGDGMTIADAIVARDQARREQQFYAQLADHAAARIDRYSRSEIKTVATVPVAELRAKADAAAQRFRALDVRLQEKNWLTPFPDLEELQ